MTETMEDSRTISTIRTGTKVAIIVGLSLVGLAAYFYFAPVFLDKPEGGVFNCGSAASPNTEAKNICGAPEGLNRIRALASLGVGVMIIVLGFALFGLRRDRNDAADAEWDDDLDLDDDHHDRDRDLDQDRDHEDRPRRRRGDDLDRRDRDRRRGRERDERDRDIDDRDGEIDDRRSARHRTGGRRSVLRDDDFADPAPRRRDDDWSSDGWR